MSDLLRSQADLLILAVLQSGPAHGYSIIEEIKRRSQGQFDLPEGTIYPALHRLETEGLLASDWQQVEGRRRRVYRLTAQGLEAGRERMADWRRFARAMQAVVGAEA
jgi:DNA-binding PadR family transcriptional regulator